MIARGWDASVREVTPRWRAGTHVPGVNPGAVFGRCTFPWLAGCSPLVTRLSLGLLLTEHVQLQRTGFACVSEASKASPCTYHPLHETEL